MGYRDCGILEWNPVPFLILSRTRIPSRYRFLRDTGWGLGPTLEMTPLGVASTLHRGPGWWARSKTRPKTKKIRAPHRADSVYYPITCVLVLFCKWQFLGGHQCPSKGSGGDRWDRKWKILKKIWQVHWVYSVNIQQPMFWFYFGRDHF